jgi:hypothetical protein
LQNDLDRLGEWAAENLVKINPSTCKAVRFTRAQEKDPLNYTLGDQLILEVKEKEEEAKEDEDYCYYYFQHSLTHTLSPNFFSPSNFCSHIYSSPNNFAVLRPIRLVHFKRHADTPNCRTKIVRQ